MRKPQTAAVKLPTGVTIRQIEQADPCSDEYIMFLRSIKSNPIDGTIGEGGFERFKSPQFGPDDVIPFATIVKTKSTGGSLGGSERLNWILRNVHAMSPITKVIEAEADKRRKLLCDQLENLEGSVRDELLQLN